MVEGGQNESASLLKASKVDKEKRTIVERILDIPHFGFGSALLAALCFGLTQATVKLAIVGDVLSPMMLNLYRTLIGVGLLLAIILTLKIELNIRKSDLLLLAVYSALSPGITICTTFSLDYASVLNGTALLNTQIFFSAVMSYLVLKEPIDKCDLIIMATLLAGVVFVVNPVSAAAAVQTNNTEVLMQILGYGLVVFEGFLLSVYALVVRKLLHIHPLVLSLFYLSSSVVVSFVYCAIFESLTPQSISLQFGWVIASGVTCVSGFSFKNLASQTENIVFVALGLCSETPIVFFLQWVIFKLLPGAFEAVGITLIFVSVLVWPIKEKIKDTLKEKKKLEIV